MREPRDFETDLEWSSRAVQSDFVRAALGKAFPDYSLQLNDGNNLAQRLGIDWYATAPSGTRLCIDAKIRRATYNDFLLEYWHTYGSPGWIEKDSQTDYLLYGWAPARVCY